MPSLHPHTLDFLEYIAANNDREHFMQAKALYQEVRDQLVSFTQALLDEIRCFDNSIDKDIQAKQCLFRIYRDARYPRNREHPYKTNLGLHINPGGKQSGKAWYYVHIEPGASFFGGGIYRAEKAWLQNLRHYLAKHGATYTKLTTDKKFANRFGEIQGESSSRLPKWFTTYTHHLDLVLRKQHLVYRKYTDKEVLGDGRFEKIVSDCKLATAFFALLNDGYEYEERGKDTMITSSK